MVKSCSLYEYNQAEHYLNFILIEMLDLTFSEKQVTKMHVEYFLTWTHFLADLQNMQLAEVDLQNLCR